MTLLIGQADPEISGTETLSGAVDFGSRMARYRPRPSQSWIVTVYGTGSWRGTGIRRMSRPASLSRFSAFMTR